LLGGRRPFGQRRQDGSENQGALTKDPLTKGPLTKGPLTKGPPTLSRLTKTTPPVHRAILIPTPSTLSEPTAPASGRAGPGVSRRVMVVLAVLVVAVLGLAAALVVINLRVSGRPDLTSKQVGAIAGKQASSAVSQLQSQPPTAVSAYRAVEAAFVVVQSTGGAAGTGELGSGVIIDSQGDILTALHVVKGSSTIDVTFADGMTSAATITSSDTSDDIAVLTPSTLPTVVLPAVLGDAPQVGDEVFAVGNPLALEASLSAGVVSGLDRTFTPADGQSLSGMIQFDAAVNPGSSGGPLVNTKGQVIGIVTGLANPAGNDEFAGIGFAVPIATAGGAAGAPAK
jgi:S1-C subfamily serine protease